MTGNCPHYHEIDHGVSFSQSNRGTEFNFSIYVYLDILKIKKSFCTSLLSHRFSNFFLTCTLYTTTFLNVFSYILQKQWIMETEIKKLSLLRINLMMTIIKFKFERNWLVLTINTIHFHYQFLDFLTFSKRI